MSANQSNANKNSWMSIVIPAGFLLIGSFIFWSYFAMPFIKSIDARNWKETSCIIISNQIKTISTRNGTHNVVDIVYSYEFQGKKYQSNRYAFRDESRDASAIVNRHPPDTRTTCYVNPRDATDEDVERLVCLVINDTDEFRRPRYKDMPCRIHADCELFENSLRIIENTFRTIHRRDE